MRKRMRIGRAAVLLVGLLMLVAALPASAKRVVNESYSEHQILGWMGSDDGSTDGEAWAIRGDNGESLGINYHASYDCGESSAPGDLAWLEVHGEAGLEEFAVSPTKGKDKFGYGYATGPFHHGSIHWETCDGTPGGRDLTSESLTIETLSTEDSLVKTSGTNSWHIPSETNNHQRDRGTMRLAHVSVNIPGNPAPDAEGGFSWEGPGAVGQHSWSAHTNE